MPDDPVQTTDAPGAPPEPGTSLAATSDGAVGGETSSAAQPSGFETPLRRGDKGQRLCEGHRQDGKACRRWAIKGSKYCENHQPGSTRAMVRASREGTDRLQSLPRLGQGEPVYVFQTEAMQRIFDKYATDPDRVDVSGELALVRTCLQGFVARLNGIQDPASIPLEAAAFLISACKDAADLAERLHRIEKGLSVTINVGQVKMLTDQVARAVVDEVGDLELTERILKRIGAMHWPTGLKEAVPESSLAVGPSGAPGEEAKTGEPAETDEPDEPEDEGEPDEPDEDEDEDETDEPAETDEPEGAGAQVEVRDQGS